MTFDDDVIVVHFDAGVRRYTLKSLGLTWPPPEKIEFMGFPFVRTNYSALTDNERKAMTHVFRGAEYRPPPPPKEKP
jgi:hypothetical protein